MYINVRALGGTQRHPPHHIRCRPSAIERDCAGTAKSAETSPRYSLPISERHIPWSAVDNWTSVQFDDRCLALAGVLNERSLRRLAAQQVAPAREGTHSGRLCRRDRSPDAAIAFVRGHLGGGPFECPARECNRNGVQELRILKPIQ